MSKKKRVTLTQTSSSIIMNPTTDASLPPHRLSTSCDRHFRQVFHRILSLMPVRLTILELSNASSSSSNPRKPPISATTSTAVKSILKPPYSSSATDAFLLPELRRTKSFSASKNEGLGFSGVFEPQRKSCDVRLRNSLWNLFNVEDDRKPYKIEATESRNLASFSDSRPSFHEPIFEGETENEVNVEFSEEPNVATVSEIEDKTEEMVVEEIEEEEVKTMKDHIDIDSHANKSSVRNFAGSFWSAASVFSKKFQQWRQKQKRSNGRSSSVRLPVEKPIERQFRETHSEVADYGFGRRSCDTDPRFSIDIGMMSLEAEF